MAVVDLRSWQVRRLITGVGARPWGIAVSAEGKSVFTANGPSDDVSIVDAQTGQVRRRVRAGRSPWGVALAAR